ncbi:adenosylcobalamin-dependent ribonucleoside-diphosphate reductase [Paenibacillus larvae]|uniref:Vitamin B12-dependent ribonucleotide reductase n=1 Tax=Paenibacillus larvae subsp. pulvifaciens TaxID=1477 RepID=A0A1V0UWT6_9BACL|nr:adenosylcobalamin-dependent ribonucleoside-diphosphate reductase [Paenibacillus larvae]AQZ45694.1 ribonucleoside-diphosphate reductase, adenosylcobalamin-dependent [Paenibacillus larvae subsp. pulvifaciens]ARF69380.1 ribonucleoside-diphosphate reductase, adenosylcobalamin-dependent [Paenibacillus larvae subsp. pulvifaciens]MBH0340827.1 ribonucleoside-diphosphate reductase [Paenibacillus larvae]MCY7519476.1 adenosylcobalamin-dependent ribonucleoside-diphosphate reductase [Paenibacillus larvae
MKTKPRLEGLSEKIFLDRYAMKNADSNETKVGDTVLVLTKDDPKFPTKEVGEVASREGKKVTVKTRSGELVESDVEKLTLNIEKTPDEMWDRLAKAMASVEKTDAKRQEWTEKFRYILDEWKLVPGGRIAAGADASDELTLFNCYVIPSPHDSRGGIMATLSEMTEIMSRGGGVGINLSSLRPRRAIVKGVNGSSSGAVSWGGLFSYTTGLIEQGGSRRGALMLMINDWHPDLLDFITIKQTMGQITNANLSVCISNSFMKAVKEDLDWELVFPDTTDPEYNEKWDGNLDAWKALGKEVKHCRTVRARDVWHTIIESAWKSAEPGVVFMEYYNQMSNSWYFNPIICTNPCGEQGLPAWGVCNLSAVNLSKFYDEKNHDVDWEELDKVVRYSVRFLDNVIDKTPYHFEENRKNQQGERRIGMGSMGLAELMIKLKIRYGSPESLEFLDKLYGFMARAAYLASSEIAAEKGSFEHFDAEKFLQSGFMKNMVAEFPEVGESISQNGMRNVTVITQAPTGSTGTMVGTSTGIEPYFAFEYFRQSRLGFDKQYVPIAQEWKDAHPDEELPDYFITAMDLSAEDHIRAQAAIQRWVDSSISKTANCPADFTVEETKRLYELAFDLGCKGVTIYRDGSRDVQVLSTDKKDEEKKPAVEQMEITSEAAAFGDEASLNNLSNHLNVNVDARTKKVFDKEYKKRPQILRGATYKINTPFGMAYITINDMNGTPSEIFLNVGKAGSDVFAMSEALGRVCSLFLRYGDHGNKVELLIKHLKGIGGSGAIGFGANRVESIADAVAKALEMHEEANSHETGAEDYVTATSEVVTETPAAAVYPTPGHGTTGSLDLCPSCGSASLINTEGCKSCANCGYSKCS